MPKMDGFEVCRQLKQDARTSHTHIIMLTAQAQEATRAKSLAAGADEYLTKPFSPLTLLRKVSEALAG